MRAVVRWAARFAIGAAVLTALVVGVALITAHTTWGRDQLRRVVEAALHGVAPGGARVGRIDGSILGTLTLRDVALLGRDGAPVATAATVRGELALAPLVLAIARIDDLVAEDVAVSVRPQPPEPPGSAGAGSAWRVQLPRVAIHRARVAITAADVTQTLVELEATGAVESALGATRISLDARGRWQDREVALAAVGSLVLGVDVEIPAATIAIGDARIDATDVRIDDARPAGALRIAAPVRALGAMFPELGRAVAFEQFGAALATADVTAVAGGIAVAARAGELAVWASLHGSLADRAVSGAIVARAADLAALTGGRVRGRGRVLAGLAHRDGALRGMAVVRCDAGADAAPGEPPPLVTCGEPDLPIAATVAIQQAADGALAISAQARDQGTLHLVATASGRRTADAVTIDRVAATATGLHRGPAALGSVLAEAHRDGDAYDVSARWWQMVRGLEIRARGRVTTEATSTIARLRDARVALPNGMVWSGAGGVVELTSTALAARDVSLAHDDVRVRVAGRLARATGVLDASVDADRLDVAALDPRYRGTARAHVALGRRAGRWTADGRLDATGLGAAGAATDVVDATARVGLAGGRATLDAAVTGARLGQLAVALDAELPRDPLDVRAWRGLEASALRRAEITARRVELAGLASLIGSARGARASAALDGIAGTLDGTLDLAPSVLRGALAVRGISSPVGIVDADLTFAPNAGDLGAHTSARLAGIATGDLSARVAVPARPFEPETWRLSGRDLVKEAALSVDDVAFDPALLARLGVARLLARAGLDAKYQGRMSLALALGAAASEARLAIDLNDVTGGPLVEPVAQRLAISAGPAGTHVAAHWFSGRGAALALGALEADLAMTTDRWILEPKDALHAALTGQWTLPATPIAPILAVFGRRDVAGGTVEASATIAGALAAPTVPQARAVIRDVAVPRPLGGPPAAVIAELEATARWDGSGHVEVVARQSTGGSLRATGDGRPDAVTAGAAALTATRFDLAPLAALLPRMHAPIGGTLDGALAVRAGRLTGALHLARGALPLSSTIGTLRDATVDLSTDGASVTATLDGKLGPGSVHLVAGAPSDLSSIDVRTLELRGVSGLGALRPVIDARVTARLRRDGSQLRGDARISAAHVVLARSAVASLLDDTLPPDLQIVAASAAASATRAGRPWLVVDVVLEPTRVEAHDVVDNVGLRVEANVRADALAVSIGNTVEATGSIVVDGSYVELLGRRYRLDPSELELDGNMDPRLAIYLAHEFPELTLRATISGRASHPALSLSSDPGGYSEAQLLSVFVGGEPTDRSAATAGELGRSALAAGLSATLGRRLTRVLPIRLDTLSCEPATASSSASCSVGRWLSRRLFITYRQHIDPLPDESASDVQVQYRFGRQSLELTGARERFGVDWLWRRRWLRTTPR